MLDPNDYVGVSFWIISAAMVAATYFFTVERDRATGVTVDGEITADARRMRARGDGRGARGGAERTSARVRARTRARTASFTHRPTIPQCQSVDRDS